jgi:hypothetical protein
MQSSLLYDSWVFTPINLMTPDQRRQWLDDCFLLTRELEAFIYAEGASVLIHESDSGRNAIIEKTKQIWGDKRWVIPYRETDWPTATPPTTTAATNQFQHLMSCLAQQLDERIREDFDKQDYHLLADLDEFCREFLLWFLHQYLTHGVNDRQWRKLEHTLKKWSDYDTAWLPLLLNTFEVDDHKGHIRELVELMKSWGYEGILVIVLPNPHSTTSFYPLFQNFSLLEEKGIWLRGFVLKTYHDVSQWQGIDGRVSLVELRYDEASIREIGRRHLVVATGGQMNEEDEVAHTAVWQRAWQEITTLYPRLTEPTPWLKFIQTLLKYLQNLQNRQADTKLPLELTDPTAIEELLVLYYQQHIQLRLDPSQKAVWRGHQYIPLTEAQYALLEKLFQLKGRPNHEALLKLAQNQANLHTQIKRLRQEIEPFAGRHTYIKKGREGYWL